MTYRNVSFQVTPMAGAIRWRWIVFFDGETSSGEACSERDAAFAARLAIDRVYQPLRVRLYAR